MGSATLYQLAKRGVDVVGIDRFSPPHTLGSSHGDTRITRQAIGEGRPTSPLFCDPTSSGERSKPRPALIVYRLWRAGTDRGIARLLITGSRVSSHRQLPQLEPTTSSTRYLTSKNCALAFRSSTSPKPTVATTSQVLASSDRDRCRRSIGAGTRYGARNRRMEKVSSIEPVNDGVTIYTDRAVYGADQVVVTAGPWISSLARCDEITSACKVYRQDQHWFDASASISMLTSDQMPVFIWGDVGSRGPRHVLWLSRH